MDSGRGSNWLLRDQLRLHEQYPLAVAGRVDGSTERKLFAVTNLQPPQALSPKPSSMSGRDNSSPRAISSRDSARDSSSMGRLSPRLKPLFSMASDSGTPTSFASSARVSSPSAPSSLPELSSPKTFKPDTSRRSDKDSENQFIPLAHHEQLMEERTNYLTKIFQEKLEKQHQIMQKKLEELSRKHRQQLIDVQAQSDQKMDILMQKYADGREADIKLQDTRNHLKDLRKQVHKYRAELELLESQAEKFREMQLAQEDTRINSLKAQYSRESQSRELQISQLLSKVEVQSRVLQKQVQFKMEEVVQAQTTLAQLEEVMEVDLTCTKCLKTFTNPVSIIPCGHTYCQGCIKNPQSPFCEECPHTINVGFMPNYALDLIRMRHESRMLFVKNLTSHLKEMHSYIESIRNEAESALST